ncbi:TOTE conflict system archaeo-eukaryotic primase domain-containing protein [Ruegeria sp.]|uniref:TOTE conflict system archaeo-eukaryotic primase domain-containing protein n=1 Tax=Ruegeria sp. TaxID=1879320 RepID=UPI003C7A1099
MQKKEILNLIVEKAGPGVSYGYWEGDKFKYNTSKGVEDKFTAELLDAHLKTQPPLGFNTTLKERRSHFMVFDLDAKPGKQIADEGIGFTTWRICKALSDGGYPHFIVRSGGGRGVHVWVVFEKSMGQGHIVRTGTDILEAASSSNEKFLKGAGGLYHETKPSGANIHEVDIYPQGEAKRYNLALPFARKSTLLDWSDGNRDSNGTPLLIEVDAADVKLAQPRKRGPKSSDANRGEVDTDRALQCYMQAQPGESFKDWSRAAFHICGAFQDDGEELFLKYSRATPGYDSDEDVAREWGRIAPKCEPNPYPFWVLAKSGGYTGGLPEGVTFSKADAPRILLEDIIDALELFQDQDGIAFARVSNRRVMRIDGIEFADLLRRTVHEAGVPASSEVIKHMQDHARAYSYAEREDVHLRVKEHPDGIFIDMCDDNDNVVQITPKGFSLITGDCPVAFRRSGQSALELDPKGTVDDIRALVNLDDDQFVIFMACAVSMFFTESPSPIVNLTGEYGAAKTSATWVMRSLLDPVTAMTTPYSGKPDDLILRAWHNAVVTLENMSDLTKISDHLCGICTGMGFETRQLYSNADMFTIFVKRPIIVNGIEPARYASDLISRMIDIELRKAEKTMSEKAFSEKLAASRPRMFGAMCNLVSDVLRILETLDVEQYAQREIRVASFAAIGEATARSMGKPDDWFVKVMEQRQEDAQLEAAMDDVTYCALGVWATDKPKGTEIRTSPLQLLKQLGDACRDNGLDAYRLPKTASTLSRALKGVAPMLRKRGWSMERVNRDWLIVTPDPAQEFLDMVEAARLSSAANVPF